jgi:hypothetical protein
LVTSMVAKNIIGIYGRKIPVEDVFKSLTTGRNATLISKMWTLSNIIKREVGALICDNGEDIFLSNFIIGYETSIKWSTYYLGGSVALGNVHTHPTFGRAEHSLTDIENMLSRGYPGGVSAVVGRGREPWKPKVSILFLTDDVIESDLYTSYMDGGYFDEKREWHDFTDEDLKKLISMLTRMEAELEYAGIPDMYYCDICRKRHKVRSGIGRWHIERGFTYLLEGE